MSTARTISLDVLLRVQKKGAYSHIALSLALEESDLDERDRSLTTELVYGTLTRQRTIDHLLKKFVSRRLDKLDVPVLIALRMAAYQLVFLDRIPDHAAVNETVDLVKERCGHGAGGFANGVLRAMLRKKHLWKVWEQVKPEESAVLHLGLKHSLPDWIARRMIESEGFDDAMRLAEAFNARPPLYFRPLLTVPDPLPAGLSPVEGVPDCFRAETLTPELGEAVAEQKLVIQDLGSQLVGLFCAPEKGATILDPCAGLGGKTLHLARLAGSSARVVAADPQGSKLQLLQDIVDDTPLAKQIEVHQTKIKGLDADKKDFDLVLIDAPCTGLGVIRRHPETRWRRSVDDIRKLAAMQRDILDEGARRVRPGGTLVYSVCTFTPEEGPQQIEAFLERHPDFKRQAPPKGKAGFGVDWSKYTDDVGDLRLNPADHDADAFYAARLQRSSS